METIRSIVNACQSLGRAAGDPIAVYRKCRTCGPCGRMVERAGFEPAYACAGRFTVNPKRMLKRAKTFLIRGEINRYGVP